MALKTQSPDNSLIHAQKVKLTNLKQMAQTVAYIQEHGYDSLDDFRATLDQASDQTSASRKSLKDTEQQIKEVNEQIHFTGQLNILVRQVLPQLSVLALLV